MNSKLEYKIKTLPDASGVYIMKNAQDEVIYVGKAINLKRRVKQYFSNTKGREPKVSAMISHISDFEIVVTKNELEALILEGNFIKQYKPHYNILLRDDKQYPFVRIDYNNDFPRVEIARKMKKKANVKYYGPFRAAHSIHKLIETLGDVFPIRTCKKDLKEGVPNGRPCLNYQIGRCLGPCLGNVTKEEYAQVMKQVSNLLDGHYDELLSNLRTQMQDEASKMNYEKAAVLRDRINAVESVIQSQIATSASGKDSDVIGLAADEDVCYVQVLCIRNGRVEYSDKREMINNRDQIEEDLLESFLLQYYSSSIDIPGEIVVPYLPQYADVLEEMLSEAAGKKVRIHFAQRGEKRHLLAMAQENALQTKINETKKKDQAYEHRKASLAELAAVCGLSSSPHRIEGYDISNTQGVYSVASMVVFEDGRPAKHAYRRFRIKTVEGPNDFASLAETLGRRFRRQMDGDDKFLAHPDLIMIDGGKEQLKAVQRVIEGMGIKVNLCSLAKKEEEIYLPNNDIPVKLPRTSGALQILQQLRDEAHRFAITYHRSIRSKKMLGSILEEVDGIGPKRRALLLNHFSNLEAIENASFDELASIDGISAGAAKNLYAFFHEK